MNTKRDLEQEREQLLEAIEGALSQEVKEAMTRLETPQAVVNHVIYVSNEGAGDADNTRD